MRDFKSGLAPGVLLSAGLRLDLGLALGSDLGRLDSHLDLGPFGYFGLLGQFIGHRITCVTFGDTDGLEMLQGLQFCHGPGQLHEVDVGAACFGKDLDTGYHVVSKAGLGHAVLCCGACDSKQFVSCHNVVPF